MKFSQRTEWTTQINELTRTADALRREGVPLIDLTLSNPTRCGFRYLDTSLLRPFADPRNLVYEPEAKGLLEAREAVARHYAARGIEVHPDQIILTANTSEAYTFLFRLLFEPGDILLAPRPSYPLLDYLAEINDVKLEKYSVSFKQSWKSDLAPYYVDREHDPRAVLVVNPNNPTGHYVHADDLAELNLFAKSRGMAIISDEVFWDYPLGTAEGDRRASLAFNPPVLSFAMSGISKILGLPQMKLSWIIASGPDKERREALDRLEVIADTFLSAGTPVQHALPIWLEASGKIRAEIQARVSANYKFLADRAARVGGVRVFPVQGGWHAVLQLPSLHTDEEWALSLLSKERVLAHPGYLFDFEEGSYLVLSLIPQQEIFEEGVQRLLRLVESA